MAQTELVYHQDITGREIAALLGIPATAVTIVKDSTGLKVLIFPLITPSQKAQVDNLVRMAWQGA